MSDYSSEGKYTALRVELSEGTIRVTAAEGSRLTFQRLEVLVSAV